MKYNLNTLSYFLNQENHKHSTRYKLGYEKFPIAIPANSFDKRKELILSARGMGKTFSILAHSKYLFKQGEPKRVRIKFTK